MRPFHIDPASVGTAFSLDELEPVEVEGVTSVAPMAPVDCGLRALQACQEALGGMDAAPARQEEETDGN